MEAFGDDVYQIFACHHGYVDLDFQRDAQRQDDTACQQGSDLTDVGRGLQPIEYGHGEVDEQSEAAGYGNLQCVHAPLVFQFLAGHEEGFEHDKQQVEQDGPDAHTVRGEHAQHIGDTGYGRGAQHGFGDEGDAESIYEQRNDE